MTNTITCSKEGLIQEPFNMIAKGTEPNDFLKVSNLSLHFGGVVALHSVSFSMAQHQICGLIGPNGAGKTSLFNCLSRIYKPSQGDIIFKGKSLLQYAPHRIATLGIGRTFQHLALCPNLTVFQNIMVGGYCRTKAGFLHAFLASQFARKEEEQLAEQVEGLIDFFDLRQYTEKRVSGLQFGVQKRVEFARALAGNPELLLLDEPASGLNHEEVESLKIIINTVHERYNLAILLVEHHMNFVMSISDNVIALNFGKKIVDAPPSDAMVNPELIAAYLGEDRGG